MSSRCWPDANEARRALLEGDGAGVKIAILDSGVSRSHPDMADFPLEDDVIVDVLDNKIVVEDGRADDPHGHGTAVAYLARRIAPRATFGNFRVLSPDAFGGTTSTRARILAGARAAIARGYQVLNCSFGAADPEFEFVREFKKWVDEAYLKRVHIVTACNNDSCVIQEWPGFFPTCINVNMARSNMGRCYYRPDLLVEFAAAGIDVTVPDPGGGYKTFTGSSFAAPQVAGYVARLLQPFPGLTVPQVKSLLQYLSDPWSDQVAASNNPSF